jgi:hypothetical protein
MSTSMSVNEQPSPHDSHQGLRRGRNRSRGLIIHWRFGVVLAVVLAAPSLWLRFSPSQVNPNVSGAAEASSTRIFPIELYPKAGKDLPDKTIPEPF